ncbi:MAG: hypothetical protein HGA19_21455 [Oscillochloris sp.]|nr:hypothetical protein [Oscillochloris sp.]
MGRSADPVLARPRQRVCDVDRVAERAGAEGRVLRLVVAAGEEQDLARLALTRSACADANRRHHRPGPGLAELRVVGAAAVDPPHVLRVDGADLALRAERAVGRDVEGVVVVAATGSSGRASTAQPARPAATANMVTVFCRPAVSIFPEDADCFICVSLHSSISL